MSSRSSVLLMWSCYFAFACGYLFLRSYWFAGGYFALSLVGLVRGIKTANLDDLSTTTLNLNSAPRARSLFSANRIFG